jgi:uncharacterized radical SAM protein YgiQ
VVVASGIRHDMILADKQSGTRYLQELIRHHVSGQMKIAPEHSEAGVLKMMGKPETGTLLEFRDLYTKLNKKEARKQFLAYYMIAAHPGCIETDMVKLKSFALGKLGIIPEQVQVFTPSPSTYSTLMYWTEQDPFTKRPCFVEKTFRGREKQKQVLTGSKKRKQVK